MQNFKNVDELVAHMFENLDSDPVSVVADKDLAVAVMKELLDYDDVILSFANIDIHDYDKEYLVSLYDDVDTDYLYVSIEQAYNYGKGKYFGTDGYVLFHENVNSKALVDMQNNENIELSGYDCFVIGKDKADKMDKMTRTDDGSGDGSYIISVKCDLDPDKALKIIEDMERRMSHMNDMFHEMDNFRRLFNW